jgi:hypothetical protein
MTRVNTEQQKYTPWFAKAGAACSIVPIARFVNDRIFALKGGGYGCLFSLAGIDEEGVTDQGLEAQVRSIEGALRGLPEGACLYQYTRVMSGFNLPRKRSTAIRSHRFSSMTGWLSGQIGGLPSHRPALVLDAGAAEGRGLHAQAEGARHRHNADAGRP